ncbi:rho GTPase-activating protein 28 isoform X2 [Protopterus annectens]|nr:rho GTPase-activating protein 28 isoform X2 [Protopterus annectens]
MLSQDPNSPPVFTRSASQMSVDSTSMEDFWNEVQSIKESRVNGFEDQSIVEFKPAEDGELEAEWLQEVGLSALVSGTEEAVSNAVLTTLTRTQAAAVEKRYNTFAQTLKKKNKQSVRDVRDVFGVRDSSRPFNKVPISSLNETMMVGSPVWKTAGLENCVDECTKHEGKASLEELRFDIPFSELLTDRLKEQERRSSQRHRRHDAALPNFTIHKNRLGVTRIQDLSPQDRKSIKCLCLIEVAAVFDTLAIDIKRNRTIKVKVRESGLFGVPLSLLLENDQRRQPEVKVPLVFQKLLSKIEETGLETEGILRVPGSASRVKTLRQELETNFYDGTFDWEQVRHNDAAGLLKMFVREMPYPLFTAEYLPLFITAAESIFQLKLQLQVLHLLILLLPDPNRDTLKVLLEFLRKVVANEEKNKMSLWNVAMIVAPNLFMCKGKSVNQQEMKVTAGAAHIVRLLIKYQDILWTIPSFLIAQVRKVNEAARKSRTLDKSMKKILQKMTADKGKPERTQSDIPQGVVRVYAPQHSKISMAIQLNIHTKAGDILARFDCENRQESPVDLRRHKNSLYEVGGNIGERCLDPDTYILDVYQINPQAEWVIKPTAT